MARYVLIDDERVLVPQVLANDESCEKFIVAHGKGSKAVESLIAKATVEAEKSSKIYLAELASRNPVEEPAAEETVTESAPASSASASSVVKEPISPREGD